MTSPPDPSAPDSPPPAADDLLAGQSIGGDRYILKRLLGHGGMGVVWLAHDTRLNEAVALKFLPPAVAADAGALQELRRETLKSRKLSHPNIVRVHDLYEAPGERMFLSMEFVDGVDLHTLRANRPGFVLPWSQIGPLMRQLCAALDYAHSERVVHRDLKPANLLLDNNGRLKLGDFGVAGVVGSLLKRAAEPGQPGGTLIYMSPQQIAGEEPRVSDDIYALGVTLYELLAGRPPFETGDLAHQHRHTRPEPMSQRLLEHGLSNDIPSEVAALVMACLAKEPEQRPPNAATISAWLIPAGQTVGAVAPILIPPVAERKFADPRPSTVRKMVAAGFIPRTERPLPAPAKGAVPNPPPTPSGSPPDPAASVNQWLIRLLFLAVLGVAFWLGWDRVTRTRTKSEVTPAQTNVSALESPASGTDTNSPSKTE